MNLAKLMTADCPIPKGHTLLGWIDRHPAGKSSSGYAVLRSPIGIEVAWNGTSVRSLPRNWREKVEFEPLLSVGVLARVKAKIDAGETNASQIEATTGVQRSKLAAYLSGEKIPRADTLDRLAEWLDLKIQ